MGVCVTPPHLAFVMPLYAMSLQQRLYGFTSSAVRLVTDEVGSSADAKANRPDFAPLPMMARVRLIRELCEAVTHLHAHGIAHRDIKPGNILLDDGNHVRLSDFGVVRISLRMRLLCPPLGRPVIRRRKP
jgi:serine/threonine protein kinase